MILSKLNVSFLTLLACCNASDDMHPNTFWLYEKRHPSIVDPDYIDERLLSGFLRTGKPKDIT